MSSQAGSHRPSIDDAERPVAAAGAAASAAALFSAAACCVLPLALAAAGIGAGGLASVVPYKWPLTVLAAAMVAGGWLVYARKRRACARDAGCGSAPPARLTFAVLCLGTAFVVLSALWSAYLEAPLMRLLGGA